MEITYTDDVGDVINVSDDEDLFVAYEVAASSMNNQIKFLVQPRKKAENAVMSEDSFEIVQPKVSQKQEVEEEKVPISSDYVKAAIKDAVKNNFVEPASSESSDSEE